ncbi:hypothetical protein [Kibdelosporangium phytohabitans]|nr:hypothetical protein [Kibdelosporangium phytohabitans]MBE1471504.1 hypothetical protein [Kibdelosporangium phytohabitans]
MPLTKLARVVISGQAAVIFCSGVLTFGHRFPGLVSRRLLA